MVLKAPWIISLASLTVASFATAAEGKICKKCEAQREYNKLHHKDYEYYEDYLKSEKESDSPCEEIETEDDENSKD